MNFCRLLRTAAFTVLLLALFALPAAHAAPGDVDPLDAAVNGPVYATAVQPDGKIIIGGSFSSVLGQPRSNIARLNADGTLDAGFNPNANGIVMCVAVQADGGILLGGFFSTVSAIERNYIARVGSTGGLDTSFNANANGVVYSVAVQADGRILLGGDFTNLHGGVCHRIGRLHANGTIDPSFAPYEGPFIGGVNDGVNDGVVYSVAVQADGGILLGGTFTSVAGVARNRIARLNADGVLDAGFNPGVNNDVYSVAVQADGGILLGGLFTTVGGTARNFIARVNAAGVLDVGFDPNPNDQVHSVAVQADGRILLGGFFTSVGGNTRRTIARVNAAGALDAGFSPDSYGGGVRRVAVQADGGILLGGSFTQFHGAPRNYFARLLNDPAVQTLSAPDNTRVSWLRDGSSPEVSHVNFEQSTDGGATWTPLGAGTRLGSTSYWFLNGLALSGVGQIRARGGTGSSLVEATASFNFPDIVPPQTTITSGPGGTVYSASATFDFSADEPSTFTYSLDGGAPVTGAGPVTFNGLAEGVHTFSVFATDTTGNADATPATRTWTVGIEPLDAAIVGAQVYATAVQPDGKTLIAGQFTSVLGQPRNNIARLNADGTLDPGFNPDANGLIYSVVVQADGRILLGGDFTSVGGIARSRIARVDVTGTLDTGFDPNANASVRCVAVQADGQILLGGFFTSVGGTARNSVARVDANGALDAGFDPNVGGNVRCLVLHPDGRVTFGGNFSTVGGIARNHIARVDANGVLDGGFDPNASGIVRCMVLVEGQTVIGGQFAFVGGTERRGLAWIDNTTGAVNTGVDFQVSGGFVSSLTRLTGFKILIGGTFASVNGISRNRVAQVDYLYGVLDQTLNPEVNSDVHSVAVRADGRIMLGGAFTSVGGIARDKFAMLLNTHPATQTLSVPDSTRVVWNRGGSSPEVSRVTFEKSTDGGTTWITLGDGTFIFNPSRWELADLALTGTGHVRARAPIIGGFGSGSSGLIEQVASFSFPVPEIAVEGNGTDIADGDTTPSPADHTDFGTTSVSSGRVVRTFTIRNLSADALNLTGTPRVAVGGAYAADFIVTVQPATPVAAGGSTTFEVTFTPNAVGLLTATLSIANDDNDENPFEFAIQGFAPVPPRPRADTVTRVAGRSLKIPLSQLLANDLHTTMVTAVDAVSAGGVPVQWVGDSVIYAPAADFNDADSFTYTAGNGVDQATATVNITVEAAPEAPTQNIAGTTVTGGGAVEVTAAGIPGRRYQLQHTMSLVSPVVWSNLGVAQTAPANGRMVFTDPTPTTPGFYRVVRAQP